MLAGATVVYAYRDLQPFLCDSIAVAAARTAGSAVVNSKRDVAERTGTFNHETDGPLRLDAQRLFQGAPAYDHARGRSQSDRVDACDVEPRYRLRQGEPWLRPLLCRDLRRALARRPGSPVPAGLRYEAVAGATNDSVDLEAASPHLRQLDERPVPRAHPIRVRLRCLPHHD